jgi:very-short-patch-repair endonuclease
MLNSLIVLPCGRRVSPDALWEQAALVHETNGREFHAGHDDFDSMQERHDAMTAAGLTVLHSSPRQLRDDAARVVAQVEACYLRGAGKGLPPGIVILRRDAAA